MDLPGRKIKAGARRTVVDLGPDANEVWKVFHARGAAGLRDGLRARAEARAAAALAEAGVPTPAPLGVRRIGGRPAVGFARIAGAVPLADALASRRRGAVARAVAELLAAMARAGATHPDLHPGNVLLDGEGVARVLDVRGARVGRPHRAWRRSAAALCGAVRERHPRVAAAAARALRERVPGLDLAALAEEARASRREACERRVRVWLRDSAAVELAPGGEVRVREGVLPRPSDHRVSSGHLPRGEARAAWATLVRAHLHALPAATPVALRPDGVDFAAPRDAREDDGPLPQRFAALLADRGLALEGRALLDGAGRALVGPRSRLVAADRPPPPRGGRR